MNPWLVFWAQFSNVILWAMVLPHFMSRHTWAIVTFSQLPEDPEW